MGASILGAGWIASGFAFLLWRAHKDGALVPALKGMLYGVGVAGFFAVGFYLMLRGQ